MNTQEIKLKDQDIHAFTEIFDNPQEKSEADRGQDYKADGLLVGKNIAVKDNLVWDGNVATSSSNYLKNFKAPYTATVVQKIIDAGATIVGKTNLDEFAMGSSTENSAFGPTKNPQNLSLVPGGSSGGSAAAVAADMAWGSLGSDTGGSIRQPAAYCGVVGFKPTYGTVSRYGLIAMGSSLDVVGPFAKNVADTKLLYKVISGIDKLDSTSRNPLPLDKKISLDNLTIGLPKEFFGEALDSSIKQKIDELAHKIEQSGGTIKHISLPSVDLALAVYYVLMPVEVSSNMARYDGIKYGFSVAQNNGLSLEEVYLKSRESSLGAEVKRRIMLGGYASSSGYADKYYLKAARVRQIIINEFNKSFEEVDVILTPTVPSLPFKFGEKSSDPLKMYLEDIYTVPANIAGIPAISLPIGKIDNLSVSAQLMAPALEDFKLLEVAELIEGLYE